MVMQWYVEFADGYIASPEGRCFDARLLDYRIDVERLLKRLHPAERAVIEGIHVEGLTQAEAVKKAGYEATRPDDVVASLEVKVGRMFDRLNMSDLISYLSPK